MNFEAAKHVRVTDTILRRALGLRRVWRVLVPSLVTLALIVLLVFTIFFTAFDWQWVAFLSGILFAAVLSLVSASWKSEWRIARRAAQAARFKDLFEAEREQHRQTRALLERETALHQQDRERLEREADALKAGSEKGRAALGVLATLEHELNEIAFLVDRDLRYRFHTRGFAAWARTQPLRIDGHLLDEPLRPQVAEALQPLVADALRGKSGDIELDGDAPETGLRRFAVAATPHYGLPQQVTGVLVRIAEITDVRGHAPADDDGSAAYVASLTEELTGWDEPRATIRQAIERDEFDLFVQDIVALQEGVTPARMHELLIRMRDEQKNLIPPGAFLPVAERCGLMPDIDRYMVAKALAAQQSLLERGTASLPLLCVNLSRATLEDRSFPEFVGRSLEQTRVPAGALCFEFDDSHVLAALAEASRLARELQTLGCRRSLGGFGASDVAFARLKAVQTDYLKIDGRIIFGVASDSVALAKVNAIQRVCRTIGVRTVAELVESDATLAMLRRLGVDYAQGFGVARPRPFVTGP